MAMQIPSSREQPGREQPEEDNERSGRTTLRNGQRNLSRTSKYWPTTMKGGYDWWTASDTPLLVLVYSQFQQYQGWQFVAAPTER